MVKYMIIIYLTTGGWAFFNEPMSRDSCLKAAEQLPKEQAFKSLPVERIVCHKAMQAGPMIIVNDPNF